MENIYLHLGNIDWGILGTTLTVIFGLLQMPSISRKTILILRPGQEGKYKNVVFYNKSTSNELLINVLINNVKEIDEDAVIINEIKMVNLNIGGDLHELKFSRGIEGKQIIIITIKRLTFNN